MSAIFTALIAHRIAITEAKFEGDIGTILGFLGAFGNLRGGQDATILIGYVLRTANYFISVHFTTNFNYLISLFRHSFAASA
jgi:sugar phosphate permease